MSTAEKIAVTFLKGWRGYNTGETAGFDPDVAEKLVGSEVAKAATPVDKGTGKGRTAVKPVATGKGSEAATVKGADTTGNGQDGAGGNADAQLSKPPGGGDGPSDNSDRP